MRARDLAVRDMLPRPADADELPVVDPDATTIGVAAVMARMHSRSSSVLTSSSPPNVSIALLPLWAEPH